MVITVLTLKILCLLFIFNYKKHWNLNKNMRYIAFSKDVSDPKAKRGYAKFWLNRYMRSIATG